MRLLRLDHDDELSLVERYEERIPPYAILSHTWGADSDEVTYLDVVNMANLHKLGWNKIHACAKQAKRDNLQYFWVDTCCIDKSSSAELTESINSMYNWYKKAKVCYVLLEDLPAHLGLEDQIAKCRWFTRGWTLQELLAPSNVEFYDQDWTFRGSRKDHTDTISEFTSIPTEVLLKPRTIYMESVGARMSWASSRVTKRTEDIAYCLLGIFEINMPLIYGEGKRAFLRLQEEIIKRNNDLTILGWDSVSYYKRWDGLVEVLAGSPAAFAGSAKLQNISIGLGPEFSITNRGLLLTGDFKLSYRSSRQKPEKSTYVLQIATTGDSATREIGLRKLAPHLYGRLRRLPPSGYYNASSGFDDSDYITKSDNITETPTDEDTIYIRTDFRHTDDFTHLAASRNNALHIPKQEDLEILQVTPRLLWDHSDAVFLQTRQGTPYPYYSSVVAVLFKSGVGGYKDHIFLVYESGVVHPVLHVFSESSAEEHLQDIGRLFPAWSEERSRRLRGSDYHDPIPEKDISWEDIRKEAPWILKKGDSVVMSGSQGRCTIRFFLESDMLYPYNIPVISLKPSVTHSQSGIDTIQNDVEVSTQLADTFLATRLQSRADSHHKFYSSTSDTGSIDSTKALYHVHIH
ncbi:unnamed protein product [Alternaria burnsii]|nr:unnamed protein product [Alternaria burnsii]